MFSTTNAKALGVQHISLAWVTLALFYSANITFAHLTNPEESHSDFILCRQCGADVADAGYIFDHFSPSSTIKANQTLFKRKNIDIQMLKNALDVEYQIVTVRKSNCFGVPVPFSESWRAEHSWFPDYEWETCLCSGCGRHLGWIFEPVTSAEQDRKIPSAERFYALVVDYTISESFADSLVIIPKSY